MSRIISNLKENAISVAREILLEEGIDGVTMRRIASECHIAVGTMYNYFSSKEYLIGCVVLEDWQKAYSAMDKHACEGTDVIGSIHLIYNEMQCFASSHYYLYSFNNWDKSGKYSHSSRHAELLREMKE